MRHSVRTSEHEQLEPLFVHPHLLPDFPYMTGAFSGSQALINGDWP